MTTTRRRFDLRSGGRARALAAGATALLACGMLTVGTPAFAAEDDGTGGGDPGVGSEVVVNPEVPEDQAPGDPAEPVAPEVDPRVTSVAEQIRALPAAVVGLDRQSAGQLLTVVYANLATLDEAGQAQLAASYPDAVSTLQTITAQITALPVSDSGVELRGIGWDLPWQVGLTAQLVPADPDIAAEFADETVLAVWNLAPFYLDSAELYEPESGNFVEVCFTQWKPQAQDATVTRLDDENAVAELEQDSAAGRWCFETDHFSTFVITAGAPTGLPGGVQNRRLSGLENQVQQVINDPAVEAVRGMLAALPTTVTEADMPRLIQVYDAFEALTPEQQELLKADPACFTADHPAGGDRTQPCWRIYETMVVQAGDINHTTPDVTVQNEVGELPWYVKVTSAKVANTENVYRNLVTALSGRNLLGIWNISATDLRNNAAWQPAAGDSVRVSLNNFQPGNATDLKVAALNADGTMTALALTRDAANGQYYFTLPQFTRFGVHAAGTSTSPAPTQSNTTVPTGNNSTSTSPTETTGNTSTNPLLRTGTTIAALVGGVLLAGAGTTLAVRSRRGSRA